MIKWLICFTISIIMVLTLSEMYMRHIYPKIQDFADSYSKYLIERLEK